MQYLRGKWLYLAAAVIGYFGLYGALWLTATSGEEAGAGVRPATNTPQASGEWVVRRGSYGSVARQIDGLQTQWESICGRSTLVPRADDAIRVAIHAGTVVAVDWRSRSGRCRAVRYVAPDGRVGFYTPDGHLARPVFLESPIAAAKISSSFGRRIDPWWQRVSAHSGVDYAAPVGTPIHAIGDGRVVALGAQGTYGNMLRLAHGEHVESLYGHMASYAPGLRVGQPVRQGDVIGYVGQSGLATGPHLHFEFRIGSRQVDPSTVGAFVTDRIPENARPDFEQKASAAWSILDSGIAR